MKDTREDRPPVAECPNEHADLYVCGTCGYDSIKALRALERRVRGVLDALSVIETSDYGARDWTVLALHKALDGPSDEEALPVRCKHCRLRSTTNNLKPAPCRFSATHAWELDRTA